MNKKKLKTGVCFVFIIAVVVFIYYYFFLGPSLTFKKQEALLEKAGKRYFEQNTYLFPQEGTTREVRLTLLYDKQYVEAMYAPHSKKLCSGEDSFVKVKKEKGVYQYYTYLSCGKYHSTTDSEGPTIVLNGKEEVTVARGSEYKELGVKSVKDNQDGAMDVKDVEIDASKVDMTTAGTYTVTYTAYDSLENQTVVKRKIRVVEKLSDTVLKATDKKGYYQGDTENNYLLFNAMLFRVVGVDDEGITIVSDETLANVDYSLSKNGVKDSSIDKWLNDYFYQHLSKKAKSYLVKNSSWCSDTLSKDKVGTTECSKTIKMNVGLLSIQDFNRSLLNDASYLNSYEIVLWMMNPSSEKNSAWTQRSNFKNDEGVYFKSYEGEILFGLRPALRLKKDVEVVQGDGTKENPFFLGDYEEARVQTLLNTRLSGEFVTYSGYLFRIVDVDDDKTTHVISDSVLTRDGEPVQIQYLDGKKTAIYNPNQKGNLGYRISNEMTQYIKTGSFVKKKVTVPIYKDRALYGQEESTKTYTLKMAAPNTFDLFSAKRSEAALQGYWYINSSKNAVRKYIASSGGTIFYTNSVDDSGSGVKISAYLDKDMKITGGSGTALDPYKITK